MSSVFPKWARGAMALPLLALTYVPAAAAPAGAQFVPASGLSAPGFGRESQNRPLWIRNGAIAPEARQLIDIIRRADLDGMQSAQTRAEALQSAIEDAQAGEARALAKADVELTEAWVDYVQTVRRRADIGMVYADASLAPSTPTRREILQAAAAAPSLARHLEQASSVNPLYAKLREGYAAWRESSASAADAATVERKLRLNLDRARMLPSDLRGKYIIVDAASQRLFMYENGEVKGSMKVVVGKPENPTPMLAGSIHSAVLNPYWNVPPDLVQKRVARNVLDQGLGYLKTKRYEILSDWTENAQVLDPSSVDWQAVAAGREEVRVRQLPGAGNAMGDMKFMFDNQFGVYLHDTPDKNLFSEAERAFSAGCVRLEDAGRVASWLFGKVPSAGSSPEEAVRLTKSVPVYITYLTAAWDGKKLAFQEDLYGRDTGGSRLASIR